MLNLSLSCVKVNRKSCQSCLKVVPKFSQSCPTVVSTLSQNCPTVFSTLSQSCHCVGSKLIKSCPKHVTNFSQSFLKLSQTCLKVFLKLPQNCLKLVSKLSQSCLKSVSKLSQSFPKLSQSCPQIAQSCLKVVSKMSQSCASLTMSAIFLFWFSLSKETCFLRSGFILTLRWSLYYFEIQQNHFLCITNCNHVAICKQSFEFSSIMLHQILLTHDYQFPRWTESIKPCGRNHSIWQWELGSNVLLFKNRCRYSFRKLG